MKYEYVVLEMAPQDDVEDMRAKLNSYGKLGFELKSANTQQDHIIYTLCLECED